MADDANQTVGSRLHKRLKAFAGTLTSKPVLKWRRDFGDARTRAASVFDDEGTPLDYAIDYEGPDDAWLLTFECYTQTRGTLIECMDAAEHSERASRDWIAAETMASGDRS